MHAILSTARALPSAEHACARWIAVQPAHRSPRALEPIDVAHLHEQPCSHEPYIAHDIAQGTPQKCHATQDRPLEPPLARRLTAVDAPRLGERATSAAARRRRPSHSRPVVEVEESAGAIAREPPRVRVLSASCGSVHLGRAPDHDHPQRVRLFGSRSEWAVALGMAVQQVAVQQVAVQQVADVTTRSSHAIACWFDRRLRNVRSCTRVSCHVPAVSTVMCQTQVCQNGV